MRRPLHGGRCVAVLLTIVVLTGGSAAAQSVLAPELKAAFLFNFAQFAEWPADAMPDGAPLAFCVVDDAPVADALERTIKGRSVKDHALTVRRLKADALLPTCHVLYLGGLDLKPVLDAIGTVENAGVFTVSAAARFAEVGGIVELFFEGGRMRIAVNLDALQRSRVLLSSRVLGLAKIVRDPPPQ